MTNILIRADNRLYVGLAGAYSDADRATFQPTYAVVSVPDDALPALLNNQFVRVEPDGRLTVLPGLPQAIPGQPMVSGGAVLLAPTPRGVPIWQRVIGRGWIWSAPK